MRRTGLVLTTAAACLALLASCSSTPSATRDVPRAAQVASSSSEFSFAAGGDHGANRHTADGLRRLDQSNAQFYLALGDMDYDQTSSDAAWCDFVHAWMPIKGSLFPFELVVGNHEEDGGEDGRIGDFTTCLPDRMGSTVGPGSRYGAEYSFSYPPTNPLATFVMLAPKLTVAGKTYNYGPGTVHRGWLLNTIAEARASGVTWIVVGMHSPCLSTGRAHGCDAGPAILNLLVKQHVDLVLTGHNHVYERSKQLRLSSACPSLRSGRFNSDCVVDRGGDGVYRKGAGTLLITAGTVGGKQQGVNPDDPDRGYFAKSNGVSTGFVKYTVSADLIHGRFVRTSGGLSDAFDIVRR